MDAKSPGSDVSNSNGSNRRNRFTLKRQDCLERGCEGELDLTITPTNVRSTPASPYSQNLGSPPAAHEHAPLVSDPPLTSSILTTPSFSLDSNPDPGFIGESLSPAPPPPPPLAHRLPSVRVIPDAVDPLSLEESSNCMNYGLLHPNFRASLEYPTPLMPRPPPVKPFNPPPNLVDYYSSPPSAAVTSSATIYSGGGPVAPPHVSEAPPTVSNATNSSSMTVTEQFGHCPKEREGPALGCNYCWNTTDVNGRILRRKTKYHCPDCQANLCIVPCFQAYHENLDRDKNSGNGGDHKA